MAGVLTGFAIIGAVVLAGYLVGRTGVLGEGAGPLLSRATFFVFAPCLLFTVLAEADVTVLFSSVLLIAALSALVAGGLFVLIARVLWRRPLAETVIGALASGYVNANNIGIPVALYVVGDIAFTAPVILLQLLVLAPIALTVLDVAERGRSSLLRVLVQPLRNPIIIGSVLGVIVSATGIELPAPVMEPFRLIGAAAVPLVLVAFGMSLHGQRPLARGSDRRGTLTAVAIKTLVMPLTAWLLGALVFGLEGHLLFGVVVLASLPSAQNVFVYAQRYDRGVTLARDAVFLSTVLAVPLLLLVAWLLAG